MPVILWVPLAVATAPAIDPVHLPGVFFRCLVAGNAELAAQVRASPPPRPYTLSQFYRQDGRWTWRVVLLQDDLLQPWLTGLRSLGALPAPESDIPLDLANIAIRHVSYEDILTQASPEHRLHLQFLSPTSFSTGFVTYPLPDPLVIFQSWFGRWNVFSPVKLARVLLDVAAVHVAISYCAIYTCVMKLGVGQEIGFTGRVTLRIVQVHKLGDEVLTHLAALARYADFCGTGQRTAQGMGQTHYYNRLSRNGGR